MSPREHVNVVVAIDCGSTTTKAILIERRPEGYRLAGRGEAPTTVEAPFDDVTVGVANALAELQELTGRRLLDASRGLLKPARDGAGMDLFLATSSAGGGLQMMVAGVVRSMTAESAERAALGAGAIVMDTIACNDGRPPHERTERIRHFRPDMILLAGGIDGGTCRHVVELAQIIAAAKPRPRLGRSFKLPVVYAGNCAARDAVQEALAQVVDFSTVANVRPILELEDLRPARERIHDLFMEHVMAQAPGYERLKQLTDHAVMPTPGAVGTLIESIARREQLNVLGVDIGGATTDVFSVFDGVFNRTVSANLGMSYSLANVLASAGHENVQRWLPFAMPAGELGNRVKNKMIRPTTIPQLLKDLQLEHALCREALRLAFDQHRQFATTLKGVHVERSMADAFQQGTSGRSLVDMMQLDLIVGSGGVLSHAPRRSQATLMLIDAFEPVGITRLAVDSIFMMPHLGVLSKVNLAAAQEVFDRDCLVPLGTVIAPRGSVRPGHRVMDLTVESGSGHEHHSVSAGELRVVPLASGETARVTVRPSRRLDAGKGAGKEVHATVSGGVVGLVLDGRGRPLALPRDPQSRVTALEDWAAALGTYPTRGSY
ncbi:MAG: glutamate mutase L [Planctomycetota bacterium]